MGFWAGGARHTPPVNPKLTTATPLNIVIVVIGDRLPWFWALPKSPLFVTIVVNRGTTSATATSFWLTMEQAEEAGTAETAEGAALADRTARADMAELAEAEELADTMEGAGRLAVTMEGVGRQAVDVWAV